MVIIHFNLFLTNQGFLGMCQPGWTWNVGVATSAPLNLRMAVGTECVSRRSVLKSGLGLVLGVLYSSEASPMRTCFLLNLRRQ